MMRPTRRICRRPPELQAANARAFSKGTPSSRRAFARDTWQKLKKADSARNVTLRNEGRRMKQNDTLISMFNPNLKKEHTFTQKKHTASGLQYWIHFWDMFKHVFPDLEGQGEASDIQSHKKKKETENFVLGKKRI